MAWGICSLVLFLAALFFAFKAKQAAGRYNMNEIDIERGQGRFGTSIGSAAMNLFWFALGLIAAVGSIGTGMRALKPDTVPSSPIVEQQVVAPPEHGFLPVEAAASSVVEHAVTTHSITHNSPRHPSHA